jgi:endonuclease-3
LKPDKEIVFEEFTLLGKEYPKAKIALNYKNVLELLIATILSAQTTDVAVNKVTPLLFSKYKTPEDYSHANPDDIENIIRTIGFYHTKAKNVIGIGTMLSEKFGGEVPNTLNELTQLPGVGRKSANVVLGNYFGIPGITVDTHVSRLSKRIGWTKETDPYKIELDLQKLFPKKYWVSLSHRLIHHGRNICKARKPDCKHCIIDHLCLKIGV